MRHTFYRLVIGPWSGRWKCQNCGLKLSNTGAVRILEGTPCR